MAKSTTVQDLKTKKTSNLLPCREVVSISSAGKVVRDTCLHMTHPDFIASVIAGLDASFCKVCRIWWIDQQMRDRLLNKNKKKINDFDEQ